MFRRDARPNPGARGPRRSEAFPAKKVGKSEKIRLNRRHGDEGGAVGDLWLPAVQRARRPETSNGLPTPLSKDAQRADMGDLSIEVDRRAQSARIALMSRNELG